MPKLILPRGGKRDWPTWLQYGFAIFLVALSTGFRFLLDPYIGLSASYVTFFLSNTLVIGFTRIGPSLLAVVLSTFAADYFFLPPRYTFWSPPAQHVTSTTFILANLVILALAQLMRRAKEQAEANARNLQREKGILQNVMNGATNSHLVFLDRDFNFVKVNETYAKTCGYKPEEMVGKNHFALYPHSENEAIFARVRDTGEAVEFHDKPFEYPDQPERGVTYWDWTLAPVRDEDEKIIGFVFSLFETTERKKAELALRETQERFRFLIESIPHLVWTARPDGTIDYVNTRVVNYTGLPLEKLAGWSWVAVLHPEDVERTKEIWQGAFTSGNEYRIEYRLRRASDGQYRWHMAHALPLRDSQGAIIRWFGTCTDIHDRKEAEDALHQAKENLRQHADNLEKIVRERTARLQELVEELERFSYTLTHDMRAPLRAMTGFAHLMWESGCSTCLSCNSRDLLERIITSSKRMDLLITEALDYNRAVRTELQLVPVDPGAVLRGMVATYPNLQPLHADISLEGTFPLVQANEAALTQCFSNLLGNAVKFVSPGTRPRVRVWAEKRDEGTVCLWFEDNGIGIAPEYFPKLFRMFERIAVDYEGTGIGLALVRKNTEHMGGRVGVESEPGKGSRFWMELQEAVQSRHRR